MKNVFILSIVVIFGLSCTEDNPVNPTINFNYDLEIELSTSGNLYTDSCPDCQNDPETINFKITLTNGNKLASDKVITVYSEPANDLTPDNLELDIPPVTTSTSGLASVSYNDNGYPGNFYVIASFTDLETDSTIYDTSQIAILPYYLKVENVILDNAAEITDTDDTEVIPITTKVFDADGNPLENMSVKFESDDSNTVDAYFTPNKTNTDINGYATVSLNISDNINNDVDFKINSYIADTLAIDNKYQTTSTLKIKEQQFSQPDDNLTDDNNDDNNQKKMKNSLLSLLITEIEYFDAYIINGEEITSNANYQSVDTIRVIVKIYQMQKFQTFQYNFP